MPTGSVKRVLCGGSQIKALPADLGLTVLRLFAGLALALGHGLDKMPPSQMFIDAVSGMGFPASTLFAWSAALSELVGGLLLAIGLFTRPASLFILTTMGVAAFILHGAAPFQDRELALIYGAVALVFLFSGAGRLSLDHFLRC